LKLPPLLPKAAPVFMHHRFRSTASNASRSREDVPPVPFRLSMSRVVGFLNILASKAAAYHGDDQNLVAELRFENTADIRFCHSNQLCCPRIPPGVPFLVMLPNSITCRMPQVSQATTPPVQSASSCVFGP
jgi:hypothetical protein